MAELFLQWLQQFMDFSTILNISIAASWMVLAVFLLRFALKKAPKWVHVLLWGLVAVRLLMPFSIESSFFAEFAYLETDAILPRTPETFGIISSLKYLLSVRGYVIIFRFS